MVTCGTMEPFGSSINDDLLFVILIHQHNHCSPPVLLARFASLQLLDMVEEHFKRVAA